MATNASTRLSLRTIDSRQPATTAVFGFGALVGAAYVLGAVALAGEAAVHIQQYESLLHGVRGIGPLFLLNAAASIAAIVGLVFARTRRLAALTGVATSAVALAALVVSYGRGLFGWFETGFRTPVELAVITELSAVIFLSVALTATLLIRSVDVAVLTRVGAPGSEAAG
jgi:hypothetical protein